jgi:hypothetical protein
VGDAKPTLVSRDELERTRRPISFSRLKRLLSRGRELPKDEYLKTNIARLAENPFRHRDRNHDRMALHCLSGAPSTEQERKIALEQANCARGKRCRLPYCFVCRQKYWRRRRGHVAAMTNGCGREALSWCTIVVGASHLGYLPVEDMITDFKGRFRSALTAFPDIRWSGRFEVDYLDQAVTGLGTWKKKTLSPLGFREEDELALLVPHVHLVLAHPGVHRGQIKYRLRKEFSGSRQLSVKEFRITRDIAASLDALVRYPLKLAIHKNVLPPRNSKDHRPARPDIVRYVLRMYRELDGRGHNRKLEFDSE